MFDIKFSGSRYFFDCLLFSIPFSSWYVMVDRKLPSRKQQLDPPHFPGACEQTTRNPPQNLLPAPLASLQGFHPFMPELLTITRFLHIFFSLDSESYLHSPGDSTAASATHLEVKVECSSPGLITDVCPGPGSQVATSRWSLVGFHNRCLADFISLAFIAKSGGRQAQDNWDTR